MTALHSLRAGIIGTGFIAPVHIEALRRLGVQVTAICGSSANAAKVAAQWGIPEVYGNYDYRALCQSPQVDVVHITSPNQAHVEQALFALAQGRHVLCEKPLGMTARDTAQVVAALKAMGRRQPVFSVNYMCRFFPAILQARAMVQRGDLGKIIQVQGHFFQDWLLEPTDFNWRVLASEGGKLRAVGDIGTHWIDAISFILGSRAQSVFAHLETFHKTRQRPVGAVQTFQNNAGAKMRSYRVDTEDFGSVLLRFGRASHGFADAVHANASISQVAAGHKCSLSFNLQGTKGSLQWDLQQPNELHLGLRHEPNRVLHRGAPGFSEDIAGYSDYPAGHAEGFSDAHKMQYRALYEHIARGGRGKPLFATAADGHHEVQLCEAILQSSKLGRWVKVPK